MNHIARRNGLQHLSLLPVVIVVLTGYAAIYHFYLAYYLFEWMASGANVPGAQMFAILFMLNGLGYLALVSALYLPALKPVRRITCWLLIGYTALTLILWYLLGNRSTEGLMDYSVPLVEGVLIVLLLVKRRRSQ